MNLCDWIFSWFTISKLYSNQSTYYAYGKKYIIITEKRFPNFVFATDESDSDVTNLAHMCAGPDLFWSGWKVTPKDMGLKQLNITLLDLKVVKFKENEVIKFKKKQYYFHFLKKIANNV